MVGETLGCSRGTEHITVELAVIEPGVWSIDQKQMP